MVSLKACVVAYGFTLLPALVSGSPLVPRYFQKHLVSRCNISAITVQSELGPQLSNTSLIFGPDNVLFPNATERWNTLDTPDVQLVVQPAAESDISKIVKYCNDNSIEFLVRNRGHGTTTSLSAFSGIEINVELLQGITIQPDGETAIFQAGTYGAEVINTLWDQGYVTTTGSTACVGLTGPSLGGGHSRYEGLYGLVMDNIVHYNIVLANGTEIGVNETSHPDLMWALKGAGHNFAIVTSLEKKIYPGENWHQHTYTWTQDKLETVFEALNTFHKSYNGTTPPKMGVNYGAIIMNTSYSTTEAVMEWGFQYAGPGDEAEALLAPFNAIGAIAEDQFDASYPTIAGTTSETCGSAKRAISSAMTLDYNITTERALYDHFVAKVAEYPDLAATAYLWHEGYSTEGYQIIPEDSTAYPHREENHLMVFFTEVPEDSDLLEPALDWAKEAMDLWNGGQPDRLPSTYVNYAQGADYETLESVYGYESWRLERLRSLKAEYDPENRFRYFVPIISDEA
ncbi:hypothetical protein PFICI_04045 [Pestalotiopsis fici W106-1]|uniref:FAD-linked oxidoreductase iacH n=1 Tax=Pestalotiopsis fici (strain W106-1 / CGMCC3.15140) TaxID=1229662 RepID=IACH_PESFW|nr:uncharacterized protein PFICI_04045 [Pestalotiopsis fici W106-1]A0A1J0KJK5.1 RecName: Full=FAD-linked oxidoreductase iacH; AltName: Full=Iso-A82775C biosynthesis cluster protein HK; Flags: Precursor [Pestalotiopsis fici W106-1]APC93982.1 oxidase/reductase [Pestalotiopsis fici]ETS86020.1 hypothetical protein PFICI_04045 [Pestalotiopsis fici W106-1]